MPNRLDSHVVNQQTNANLNKRTMYLHLTPDFAIELAHTHGLARTG